MNESKPAPAAAAEMIRVRPLGPDAIRALSTSQLIYVVDERFSPAVLVPAFLRPDGEYYLNNRKPSAPVRPVYGPEVFADFNSIYIADDDGEEMPVARQAGSRLSSTCFFTGMMDEAELEERFKRALSNEFGPRTVELWNLRSGPVRELYWDVWEVRTGWTQGSGGSGEYREVERRLIQRKVRDGHHLLFQGKASPGWTIATELHQPDAQETEIL